MANGFWSKLIGIEEDEDEEEEEVVQSEASAPAREEKRAERSYAPSRTENYRTESSRTDTPRTEENRQTVSSKKFTKDVKMIVIEPQSFEESPKLVDSLKLRKPIIINLENLDTDIARKIFDFLSGATYALNGNVQKIANNIFVFTPENVDVTYSNGTKKTEEPQKSLWNQN